MVLKISLCYLETLSSLDYESALAVNSKFSNPNTTLGLQGESDLIQYVLSDMTKEELSMVEVAQVAVLDWFGAKNTHDRELIMSKWNGFDGIKKNL